MKDLTRKDFLKIVDEILTTKELNTPLEFRSSSLNLSSVGTSLEKRFAEILTTTFIVIQMLAAIKNNFDIELTDDEQPIYSEISKKITNIHQNNYQQLGSNILQHIQTLLTQQLEEYCRIVPAHSSSKAQMQVLIKRFLNPDTILHPKFPNYLMANEHKPTVLVDTFGMLAIEIQIENRIINLTNNSKNSDAKTLQTLLDSIRMDDSNSQRSLTVADFAKKNPEWWDGSSWKISFSEFKEVISIHQAHFRQDIRNGLFRPQKDTVTKYLTNFVDLLGLIQVFQKDSQEYVDKIVEHERTFPSIASPEGMVEESYIGCIKQLSILERILESIKSTSPLESPFIENFAALQYREYGQWGDFFNLNKLGSKQQSHNFEQKFSPSSSSSSSNSNSNSNSNSSSVPNTSSTPLRTIPLEIQNTMSGLFENFKNMPFSVTSGSSLSEGTQSADSDPKTPTKHTSFVGSRTLELRQKQTPPEGGAHMPPRKRTGSAANQTSNPTTPHSQVSSTPPTTPTKTPDIRRASTIGQLILPPSSVASQSSHSNSNSQTRATSIVSGSPLMRSSSTISSPSSFSMEQKKEPKTLSKIEQLKLQMGSNPSLAKTLGGAPMPNMKRKPDASPTVVTSEATESLRKLSLITTTGPRVLPTKTSNPNTNNMS